MARARCATAGTVPRRPCRGLHTIAAWRKRAAGGCSARLQISSRKVQARRKLRNCTKYDERSKSRAARARNTPCRGDSGNRAACSNARACVANRLLGANSTRYRHRRKRNRVLVWKSRDALTCRSAARMERLVTQTPHLLNTHRYQLPDASYTVSQHNWLRRCPPPPDVTAQSYFSGIKRRTGMVRTPLVFSAYDVKLEA